MAALVQGALRCLDWEANRDAESTRCRKSLVGVFIIQISAREPDKERKEGGSSAARKALARTQH